MDLYHCNLPVICIYVTHIPDLQKEKEPQAAGFDLNIGHRVHFLHHALCCHRPAGDQNHGQQADHITADR